MLGPRDQYLLEMHGKYGYYATWIPNVPLKLGDVGIVRNNVFRRITSLEKKGLKFKTRPGEAEDDLNYASASGVSVKANAAGSTPGVPGTPTPGAITANIVVEFGSKPGVVFQALGTLAPSIEDQETLGQQIIDLYKDGKWNRDYAVITDLVTAASMTVLISNGSSAKIELAAAGTVSPGAIRLADVNAKLTVTSFDNIDTQIVAQKDSTPMFRASRIKRGRILRPVFRATGLDGMDFITPDDAKGKAGKELVFAPVDFEISFGQE